MADIHGESTKVEYVFEDSVSEPADDTTHRMFASDVELTIQPNYGQCVTFPDADREFSGSFSFTLEETDTAALFGWLTDAEVCSRCGASFDTRRELSSHVEATHNLRL